MSVNHTRTTLIIDPEIHALIPPLQSEERNGLEASIKSYGCRDPLVIWEGHNVILDGHNRFEICSRLKIQFETTLLEFSDREKAKLWVISNQLHRRNLLPLDRIRLTKAMEEVFRKRAKENQGTRTDLLAILPQSQPIDTRKQASQAAGVSEKTYAAGKKILEATPELQQAVNERKVSINGAAKLADLLPDRQREIASQPKEDLREEVRKARESERAEASRKSKYTAMRRCLRDITTLMATVNAANNAREKGWGGLIELIREEPRAIRDQLFREIEAIISGLQDWQNLVQETLDGEK